MELSTLETGYLMNKMVKAWKYGLMDLNLREITVMVAKMGQEFTLGRMVQNMMDNGKIIIFLDLEYTHGQT